MKRFIQMLLLMLFFAAFTVAVPSGPTNYKCEVQKTFIQAQPDNMLLISNTPIYQPGKGFYYGSAIWQGDVEKSSFITFNLIACCSQSQLSPGLQLLRSGYMKLNGNSNIFFRGRYRLDIGEIFSQDRVISGHNS